MSIVKSVFAASLLAFAGAALAQPHPPPDENAHFGWADVLRVDPVYVTDAGGPPQQECYDEQVTTTDNNHTGGTVLGAIVGGALGNQVGKGKWTHRGDDRRRVGGRRDRQPRFGGQ